MKKFLLFAVLQTSMFIGFAQKTTTTTAKEKVPTKEQTMDWIGGKMQEFLAAPRQFVSYKNGIFTYTRAWEGQTCTNVIDLTKVTGMSSMYTSDVYISGKSLLVTTCTGDASVDTKEFISISGPNYTKYTAPFDFKMDNNLVERMKKALQTLMNYNSPLKNDKEAF